MIYQFIDKPVFYNLDDYNKSINKVVDYLSGFNVIKSIYQIGSISNPGISDIDLVVVFKDNTRFTINPASIFDKKDRYLFTHQLFGITERQLIRLGDFYSQFNFKYLYGEDELLYNPKKDIPNEINQQVALEYIIKNYLSLSKQVLLNIIKLRAFLLEAKALTFDLKMININDGNFKEIINEVLDLRKSWFAQKMDYTYLSNLIKNFLKEMESTLNGLSFQLLLADDKTYALAKNILLFPGPKFKVKSFDISKLSKLPISALLPRRLERRYFNLLSKNSKLEFFLKISTNSNSRENMERIKLNMYHFTILNEHYPFFVPLVAPLQIKVQS